MRAIVLMRAVTLTVALILAAAPTSAAAPPPGPVAAFLGDSYTQGYGIDDRSMRWSTLVANRMGWQEDNFGVGGTGYVTSSKYGPQYADRLDAVVDAQPDIVVVSGGVNDRHTMHEEPDLVAYAVTHTYAELRSRLPKARIIAVGPHDVADVTDDVIRFDQDVQQAAKLVDARYISMIDPPIIRPDMVLGDNLHVDYAGHQAIADRVISALTS